MRPKTLRIEVVQICGRCPVYKEGDSFLIESGYKLHSNKPICMHSLASLMPYYVALSRGVEPTELGLAKEGKVAYVQCLDPCDLTGGGTVIFAVRSEGAEEHGGRDGDVGEQGRKGKRE